MMHGDWRRGERLIEGGKRAFTLLHIFSTCQKLFSRVTTTLTILPVVVVVIWEVLVRRLSVVQLCAEKRRLGSSPLATAAIMSGSEL